MIRLARPGDASRALDGLRALGIEAAAEPAPQPPASEFEALLDATRGIWTEGDGAAYQERLRAEWETGR